MEGKIVYFEKAGRRNADEVLRMVKARAKELGIKTVLVASTKGDMAVKAVAALRGLRVIAVSHSAGFEPLITQEFTEANRKLFESQGGTVVTCTHAFAGISRAVRNQFGTHVIGDIVANSLRIFGEGMKVVVEIAMMAADAGVVGCDADIISIAGTGHGADTAVVLTPVNTHNFFCLKVKEILCKPHF